MYIYAYSNDDPVLVGRHSKIASASLSWSLLIANTIIINSVLFNTYNTVPFTC